MSAIDTYLENYARIAQNFSKGELSARPVDRAAVVTCMDSRILAARLLGLEEGDAHIIRNAGGVVTEDTIRSLTISQHVLGTREIMLIQHTDCGLLTTPEDVLKESIEREAGQVLPFPLHAFVNLHANVRESIERIRTSPFVKHKDAVRGFVYEVESGHLREVV